MQDELIIKLAEFAADPLGFVMFAYPWGEEGDLEDYSGPEPWQKEILYDLGSGVLSIEEAILLARLHDERDADVSPLQFARASGHGIGKSALVCWIIDWAMGTMADTKGIVTANTENQLKTKTWAEMAKWHRLSITKMLFKITATARFSVDPDHEKTWRMDMIPWSEKNMEAFAGLHNKGKRLLIVFDEASAIPDLIWETTEGALTDKNTQIIWICFGNPTKNSGRFRECFDGGKFAHRWNAHSIDSRESSITNHKQIQDWIDDYGEDSDFVRVRVRGVFPRLDSIAFISLEAAREAAARALPPVNQEAVVLGVDVARFGDDKSIIYPRQGRDARTRPVEVYEKLSTVQLVQRVVACADKYHASVLFVDGGGVGGGVVDQLNELGYTVYEVTFGAKADNANPKDPYTKYANKRAEIWGAMRDYLETACIPDKISGLDRTLTEELCEPSYTMVREDYIQLESKRDMRRRNVASPDASDALACTFAFPYVIPSFTSPREPEYYTPASGHTQEQYA